MALKSFLLPLMLWLSVKKIFCIQVSGWVIAVLQEESPWSSEPADGAPPASRRAGRCSRAVAENLQRRHLSKCPGRCRHVKFMIPVNNRNSLKLNLIDGQLDSKFLMSLQLLCSPAPLCHLTVKTTPVWSAAPWPLKSSWKVCNTVASYLSTKALQCDKSFIYFPDLGWDNWVIHPLSLTVVRCARCDSSDKTVQCPAAHDGVQNRDSKVTSKNWTPEKYEYYLLTKKKKAKGGKLPIISFIHASVLSFVFAPVGLRATKRTQLCLSWCVQKCTIFFFHFPCQNRFTLTTKAFQRAGQAESLQGQGGDDKKTLNMYIYFNFICTF